MTPEFSRPLSVARVSAAGLAMTVTASVEECAALATRFELPGIAALSCRFVLRPAVGGAYEAEGTLRARITQLCVVSLEAFDSDIREEFRLRFVAEEDESADEDPDAVDEVPFSGDLLDLGEATAQQLALALDPYPRKPGAALELPEDDGTAHPFAGLARLRRPQ